MPTVLNIIIAYYLYIVNSILYIFYTIIIRLLHNKCNNKVLQQTRQKGFNGRMLNYVKNSNADG